MSGVAQITCVLPHRHPALLIDRISGIEPGVGVRTQKAVSVTDPGYRTLSNKASELEYVYPVGRLLESWAQSAVLLACWEEPNPDVLEGKVALLAGVKNARTFGPVYPGQVVDHEVRVVRDLGDTLIITGGSSVAGRQVLEVGQLVLALRGTEALTPQPEPTAAPRLSSPTTTDKRS
ncbi:3-hydroxyacyl-ACP dehydratase [Streptomyces sp. C11-1]|uniref:3-hydroxyacyl-ACP dehydratase n=1 Tax=Streptomyces durocortorensis TaxID=2811104 RepID=A0ABY9VVN8_9ACTN|nr:3-hydroxyacyl-ACP dehydratase [Streptomyces durocortorensis]WNF27994.1 3-hydroxyacyl-ACP dehydratase [Streptomyces durocortorensis]